MSYRRSIDEVLAALGSDRVRGLDSDEAARRLSQHGPNELEEEKGPPAWREFLAQFEDPLVLLLIVATVISAVLWFVERDSPLPYEAIAIASIVILNALLGFFQKRKAEAAVAALRGMAAAEARVVRDGETQSVTAEKLVPGDLILIEEGDTIPADARLIQIVALQTGEGALTGESLPVEKDAAPLAGETPLGDRFNMVFSGTTATSGRGRAVVVATGMKTEMGRIAGLLKRTESEETPLQKELALLGKRLGL
ncbi:MAG: HAD-IC family P-type ATPase, partial [Acidobacteria bacterium]|nr:HAD-IC family P-type ATPase [Acidobacteriota bacterium]